MTIEDIAKMAGVSAMTVSRMFNEPSKVKKATRDKIENIVKRVNYRPNLIAKSLVNGNTKTIGVLYSNIRNPIYLDVIRGIDNIAYANDYIIMNANVENYDVSVRTLDKFISSRVDGLIVLPMDMAMGFSDDYQKAKREMEDFYRHLNETLSGIDIPAITLYQRVENAYNVTFDFANLAEIAVRYLIGKGFRRISMINSYTRDGLWKEKEDVYIRLMRESGLEKYVSIAYCHINAEGGLAAMNELLSKKEPLCEAVFCANDLIAIGAVHALGNAGIKIPEQVSVIGNDNAMFCEMTFPKLTSVNLNPYSAGQQAMNMMLGLMNGVRPAERVTRVEHVLVERGSVKNSP